MRKGYRSATIFLSPAITRPLQEIGHHRGQPKGGRLRASPQFIFFYRYCCCGSRAYCCCCKRQRGNCADYSSTNRPGALKACPQRQCIPTVQRNPVGAMHSDGVFMSLPKLQCRMHRPYPYPGIRKLQKNFYALCAKEKREKIKKCRGRKEQRGILRTAAHHPKTTDAIGGRVRLAREAVCRPAVI
jgi:hypothetical protein